MSKKKSVLIAILLVLLFIAGANYVALPPQGKDYDETIKISQQESSANVENISLALGTKRGLDVIYHAGNRTYAGSTLNNGICIPVDYRDMDYPTIQKWVVASNKSGNDGHFYKEIFQEDKIYVLAGIMVGDKVYYYCGYCMPTQLGELDKFKVDMLYDSSYRQAGNEVIVERHINWIKYTLCFIVVVFVLAFWIFVGRAESKRN